MSQNELEAALAAPTADRVKAQVTRVNALRQAAIDFTRPAVRMSAEQVGVIREDGATDVVLVLRIPPSEGVHETHLDECYLRIGDESRKLSAVQRTELAYDRGVSVYNGTPVDGAIESDLDATALREYREAARSSSSVTRSRC